MSGLLTLGCSAASAVLHLGGAILSKWIAFEDVGVFCLSPLKVDPSCVESCKAILKTVMLAVVLKNSENSCL